MAYINKNLQIFLILYILGYFKLYRFQNETPGFLNLVQLQFVLRRFEVLRQLLCVMQYRVSLAATDELGLDNGVNAVSVATVDSVKNSLSEDKDKQEDKSNKDEFTIASVYNENRQARGDVGKVREDDSKTNKLNNAGDLDAKENDKLVKEVSKELSGAKAALYNDENTDAKKQNYKGMYDGEENKVYVNTDKTDITDAGEYVNLVYHENRHAQKTQEGIENTADQEELVTHYGDRAEKLWEDANRREGKTTGGTTQKTISEWRQENNANYPSVFKNSEASKVDNEQPFEFGKKDINNTFGLLKWVPITTNTKTDDYLNVETKHEHGFYEDGSGDNIGFGEEDGKMDKETREGYTFDGKHYDDDIMRQAEKNLDERGELDKSKYSLVGNNCQDFADKLREEYKKIKQNQEE